MSEPNPYLRILLFMLTFLVGCPNGSPYPTPPATGVTYRIAVSQPNTNPPDMQHWTDWTAIQRAWLAQLPRSLRTGDTFVMVQLEAEADFVLRTFDAPSCDTHGAAAWLPSDPRSVYLNTACLSGEAMLLYAATHELEHALDWRLHNVKEPLTAGRRHICRHLGDRPDCHPTIHGIAILGPALPGERDANGDAVYNHAIPTPLDVQLLHPR